YKGSGFLWFIYMAGVIGQKTSDHPWAYMPTYGHICPYVTMHDHSWPSVAMDHHRVLHMCNICGYECSSVFHFDVLYADRCCHRCTTGGQFVSVS
ncbi:hypothetical protein B0H13DRAFT_2133173, partial [Mycena leptocephala]